MIACTLTCKHIDNWIFQRILRKSVRLLCVFEVESDESTLRSRWFSCWTFLVLIRSFSRTFFWFRVRGLTTCGHTVVLVRQRRSISLWFSFLISYLLSSSVFLGIDLESIVRAVWQLFCFLWLIWLIFLNILSTSYYRYLAKMYLRLSFRFFID